MKTYTLHLTYEEIMKLDGMFTNQKINDVIEVAKQENTIGFEFPFMNEVILKAQKTGIFSYVIKGISSCSICGKKHTYSTYTRSSRHHRKGDLNYDRPYYYQGIEYCMGSVNMIGYGHICLDCATEHNITKKLVDYIVNNDLKVQIKIKDVPSKYTKVELRGCFGCHAEIAEDEMTMLPAVFGGIYPGGCPHCGAKSMAFGSSHKFLNKFVMRENNN